MRVSHHRLVYESFASLPDDVQERIKMLVAPAVPEQWVRTPIAALDNETFLDVMNRDGGIDIARRYFEQVEAFERPSQANGPEDLGHVFHFDAADLDANRAGLISGPQRSRLLRQDVVKLAAAAACLIAGTVFNIGLVVGWMPFHGRGVALGLVLWVVGVILAVLSGQLWLDLARGTVTAAAGDLRSTERASSGRYGPSIHYFFEIDGQSFEVSRVAHDQVHEGKRRLYYLPRSRTVLSVDA